VVADSVIHAAAGEEGLHEWLTANRPELAGRIVWMSAAAMPAQAGNHAGNASFVLQKPFQAADLLSAVEMALGHVQPTPI